MRDWVVINLFNIIDPDNCLGPDWLSHSLKGSDTGMTYIGSLVIGYPIHRFFTTSYIISTLF